MYNANSYKQVQFKSFIGALVNVIMMSVGRSFILNIIDEPRDPGPGANKGFCSVVKYHGSTLHFAPFSQR